MKYNIKDGDKLLNTVDYLDSIPVGIMVENSDERAKGFLVGTSDNATFRKLESNILSVADSSKLGKELHFKENTSLGVPDKADEGIPEGGNICTDLV